MTDRHDKVTARFVLLALALCCLVIAPLLLAKGRSQVVIPGSVVDDASRAMLLLDYEQILDRASHYEDMLVTIGTISLAILAGIGGLVFTKDFSAASSVGLKDELERPMSEKEEQAHCNKIYSGILTLTLLTTVAYTHVFRYYCLCYAYACELEIRLAPSDVRSRMNSSIWSDMTAGAMPPAGLSFAFIGLYSVAISLSVIYLFGRRFKQSQTRQVAIAAVVVVTALLYVLPPVGRYLQIAATAQSVLLK